MMDFSKTQMKHGQAVMHGDSHRADTGDDMSLAGITVVISLASLIGVWGLACLASALVQSGGVLGLGVAWVSAVFGF